MQALAVELGDGQDQVLENGALGGRQALSLLGEAFLELVDEADHARLEVQRTRLSLQARLAAEYKDYRDSAIAVERYRTKILPKARQAYDLYLSNFRQMAAAYPQALIAQRNLFQFQDSYVAALVNTWQRAIEIQGLLLGGTSDFGMPKTMAEPRRPTSDRRE